jgi:hypothetical protein
MIITTKTEERNIQIKSYWDRFHAEKQALYKKQIIKGCIIAPFIFLLPYIFFILLLLISGNSFATGLADLKFGRAQIADSQWNVQACTQTATCQIYSKNPGTVYKIPWTSGQLSWATGDYVAFIATGNSTNPWNAVQYNSAGTQKAVMGTGHIINMGADYFFFVGNDNDTGQLFSMTQGFANTSGVTWTGTLNPTIAQTNAYAANGSTTPLAAGQTAAPAGPPPPAPTAIYMNNATVKITRAIPTTSNSPGSEGPNSAFDNNPNTKYLNFDKANAGVTVQLNTGRIVTGFTVTTANDFSGRDPTSYKLYGSNDGVTWVLIKEDSISLSESRFTTSSTISVANTTAYAYYFMLFPTTKAGNGCGLNCDSMQIAELTYYYDANNNTTSTASSNNIVDPVTAASGPTIEGGTITQTNAPANQTFTSGGSSSAGPTIDQQARYNAWNNGIQATDNYLYIEQVGGNYNTVNITQSGTKNTMELGINGNSNSVNATQTGVNYLNALVQGSTNSVTSLQTNTSGTHYQETKIMTGNNNAINVVQKDNGNSLMFNTITGNSNTITAVQEGSGNHYLENKLTGNGNSVLANQSGSTANKANIDLTNAGGPATIDLQQSGGKNFTIIQSCTNPAGCSTTIRQ